MADQLVSGKQLWRVLLSRLPIVLLMTLLTTAIAFVVVMGKQRWFSAESTVLIEYSDLRAGVDQSAAGRYRPDFMQTQIGIVASERVARAAVDLLEKDGITVEDLLGDASTDESTTGEPEGFFNGLKALIKKELRGTPPTRELGNIADARYQDDRQMAALGIRANLAPYLTDNSRLIQVLYNSTDPLLSAAVSNAVADAYVQTRLNLSRDPARRTAEFLEGQLAGLRKNLEQATNRLSTYEQEKRIVSADGRVDVEIAYLNALSSQLVEAQASVASARSRTANLEAAVSSGAALDTLPDITTNRLVQDLKVALSRKQAQLSELSTTYGEKHPLYINLATEVQTLTQNLKNEIGSIVQSQRNQEQVALSREKSLQQSLEEQRNRLLSMRKSRDDLPALTREVESAQNAYDDALRDAQRFSLLGQTNETNAVVLNRAVVPDGPSSPNVLRSLMAAAVLGSLLGLLLALALEFADNRVRHSDEILPAIAGSAPVLAEIPRF